MAALETADRLGPGVIRRRAEHRFAPERMVATCVSGYGFALTGVGSPLASS
jgi:hypothetical protein